MEFVNEICCYVHYTKLAQFHQTLDPSQVAIHTYHNIERA
jgi:hypothetical protein